MLYQDPYILSVWDQDRSIILFPQIEAMKKKHPPYMGIIKDIPLTRLLVNVHVTGFVIFLIKRCAVLTSKMLSQ